MVEAVRKDDQRHGRPREIAQFQKFPDNRHHSLPTNFKGLKRNEALNDRCDPRFRGDMYRR